MKKSSRIRCHAHTFKDDNEYWKISIFWNVKNVFLRANCTACTEDCYASIAHATKTLKSVASSKKAP